MKTRRRIKRERVVLNLFARWMSSKRPEHVLLDSPWIRERATKTAAQHRVEARDSRMWLLTARRWCGPLADPFCVRCGSWFGRWCRFSRGVTGRDGRVIGPLRFCSYECMHPEATSAATAAVDSAEADASSA